MFVQRLRFIMIEVFKIMHENGPSYMQQLLSIKNCTYETRISNQLNLPVFKTKTYGQNSFRYKGAQIWNNLPNNIKNVPDLKMFKEILCTWNGPSCGCSYCKLCCLNLM